MSVSDCSIVECRQLRPPNQLGKTVHLYAKFNIAFYGFVSRVQGLAEQAQRDKQQHYRNGSAFKIVTKVISQKEIFFPAGSTALKIFIHQRLKGRIYREISGVTENSRVNLVMIVYAHGRRLCSNRFRHGSTTISYPQCSLTFLREHYLHRGREQSFAIRAFAMSAVGINVGSVHKLFAYRVVSTVGTDIVSSHTKFCRIAYGITR